MTHFRHRLNWQTICLLLGLTLALPFSDMRAQGEILVTTQSAPVNTLTVNDVDFIHATAPKWLFTIDLRTRDGSTVRASMTIRLTASLADGENFGGAPIVTVTTQPFDINGSRTITNLDFRDAAFRKDYEVDQSAKRYLEQTALPSGRMPAGTYSFAVEAFPEGTGAPGTGEFTFVLSNPSSVELLLPVDGDVTPQFPLFQWVFDGPSSTIAVFEKLPGQATLEEAASGTPHLTTEVTTTSFQYPVASVRALEPGKTYVWYVEGHVLTSGGNTTLLRSPLRSFTVQADGSGVSRSASVLEDLEQALGPRYKGLFEEIRTQGLSPSGVFRVNGTVITASELMQLINQMRRDSNTVISADLE